MDNLKVILRPVCVREAFQREFSWDGKYNNDFSVPQAKKIKCYQTFVNKHTHYFSSHHFVVFRVKETEVLFIFIFGKYLG